MSHDALSARGKALSINLAALRYGTFAEIGAGQEVARWFFHVGRGSATVAKSISAYDKAVSDALYGTAAQFVSRARLEAMLDREFSQLVEQLDATLRRIQSGDATWVNFVPPQAAALIQRDALFGLKRSEDPAR